ncbi:MAG: DUF58 domain-containing protein [Brevinematales bacterium]
MRNSAVPGRIVIILLCIHLAAAVFSVLFKPLLQAGFILDGLLVLIMAIDIAASPGFGKGLSVELVIPEFMKINTENPCVLNVKNSYMFPVKFLFLLDLDVSFPRNYSKMPVTVYPESSSAYNFTLYPLRRGEFNIRRIYLKGPSLMGLWVLHANIKQNFLIKVVPSPSAQAESFRLIHKEIRKSEGNQKTIMFGDGTNFEMLRDYIKGDEFGKIDWKATARSGRPVSRIYRLENDLHLAVLLDCGRLMAAESGGMSALDHAIRASLVLSYAAAKNGDRVSLTAFGRDIIKYMPPTKDLKIVNRMKSALSGIQYDFSESDYRNAFSFLQSRLKKRSLAVIFTDLIDDSSKNIFYKHLSIIKKSHMVLLILLRDKTIFETADSSGPGGQPGIFAVAAAADMVMRRNRTIAELKRIGVEVLDIFPEDASASVINSYFRYKRKL